MFMVEFDEDLCIKIVMYVNVCKTQRMIYIIVKNQLTYRNASFEACRKRKV